MTSKEHINRSTDSSISDMNMFDLGQQTTRLIWKCADAEIHQKTLFKTAEPFIIFNSITRMITGIRCCTSALVQKADVNLHQKNRKQIKTYTMCSTSINVPVAVLFQRLKQTKHLKITRYHIVPMIYYWKVIQNSTGSNVLCKNNHSQMPHQ